MPGVTLEHPRVHYLNVSYGVKSWLLTVDHKRIGLLYLASITFFFALGGVYATLIRLELLTPNGDLVSAETYNKLFTMHGVVMIFFFLIPSIPAVLGNFLIPLMIGARDVAFPKLNLLSWYVFMLGAAFMIVGSCSWWDRYRLDFLLLHIARSTPTLMSRWLVSGSSSSGSRRF